MIPKKEERGYEYLAYSKEEKKKMEKKQTSNLQYIKFSESLNVKLEKF